MDLSVVIPFFNEEQNISMFFEELCGVLQGTGLAWEVLAIDDGSTDATFSLLKGEAQKWGCVKVLRLRKNFGQTAALSAGFDLAEGEIIVTMDGDLQNDPHDIPALLTKIGEGFDIVSGWREKRQDPFLSRRLPSIMANKMISLVTGVKLHDYGCTLKAFRKEVAKNIRLYGELHRFIPAVASWMGVTIAEIPVNHRARKYGRSKYGISRTIRVLLDLITVKFLLTYSTRPIHVFGLWGFLAGAVGLGLAAFLTVQRLFFGVPLANRPILLLAILLIFIGIQFISMGLLGELQVRTYHESQGKPIYYIKEIFEPEKTIGS
ncbi:MAG TPA: glycosyltransferase family 2 protein [Thermodesulfobacteriota bacterium]|nr:glycosyltransferase family 2 protein [Thermodesulfobacteriota bacterium]